MHDIDPVFESACRDERLKDIAENVVGFENPLLIQSMYIFKVRSTQTVLLGTNIHPSKLMGKQQPRIGGEGEPKWITVRCLPE